MDIQIQLQDYSGNLADLCTKVEYTSYLHDQCSKLHLYMQEDPNGTLKMRNGLQVKLIVDGVGVFLGYIFKCGMDSSTSFKVDCHDQTYYLKNEEIYLTSDQTCADIFEQICAEQQFQYKIKTPTNLTLPTYLHDKKSLYKIIKWGLDQHLINTTQYCFIRDNFGTIELTDVEAELTDLTVSDKELALSYKYEIDITPNTYNYVKVVRNNYETGLRDVWITKDSYTMSKWGHLQKLVVANETDTEEQITLLSEQILKLHNKEQRTLSVVALGNTKIKAGSGIIVTLERLNIKQNMWINKVVHKFDKDLHIMEMELFLI